MKYLVFSRDELLGKRLVELVKKEDAKAHIHCFKDEDEALLFALHNQIDFFVIHVKKLKAKDDISGFSLINDLRNNKEYRYVEILVLTESRELTNSARLRHHISESLSLPVTNEMLAESLSYYIHKTRFNCVNRRSFPKVFHVYEGGDFLSIDINHLEYLTRANGKYIFHLEDRAFEVAANKCRSTLKQLREAGLVPISRWEDINPNFITSMNSKGLYLKNFDNLFVFGKEFLKNVEQLKHWLS
ncbi:MAG: hypothetical protein MR799_09355 [Lachnospiraceae bacterium]|nr:hypothetical protein [Lachnospiraceae bacterium]